MIGALASYATEAASRANRSRADDLVAAGVPLVWDSGAWSVFTGAADVTVDQHSAWVAGRVELDPPDVRFIALDVIGDHLATLANYRDQRGAGLPVEPTFHYGEPLDHLADLLAVGDTEWMNVGGLVGATKRPSEHRNVAAFIAAVRRRLPPEVRLHALGCVHPAIVSLVPLDACDSTYWLGVGRYRSRSLFDDRRGTWRKFSAVCRSRDDRRFNTWDSAYSNGRWLRDNYGITPDMLTKNYDNQHDPELIAACLAGHQTFAAWAERRHDRPMTIYLAGSLGSDIARATVLGERTEQEHHPA